MASISPTRLEYTKTIIDGWILLARLESDKITIDDCSSIFTEKTIDK